MTQINKTNLCLNIGSLSIWFLNLGICIGTNKSEMLTAIAVLFSILFSVIVYRSLKKLTV